MLRILGEVRIGEARLRFRSRRAYELIGLLAVSSEDGIARSHAMATLWPEAEPERAAHNLRQTLLYLRESLTDAGAAKALETDRERVRLGLPVDAREFARLAAGPVSDWSRALALDSGVLLPEIEADWAAHARDAHADGRLNLLVRLSGTVRDGDPGEALRLARLATEADELLESARRAVIEAFVALGERPRAVEEFAAYDRLLRAELGLAASPVLREIATGDESLPIDTTEPHLPPAARLAVAVGGSPRYEATEHNVAGRAAIERALAEAPNAPPDARAVALAWISRFDFALGDWTLALEHGREALALALGGGAASFARVQLARVLAWTGAPEEATALAEAALRAAKGRHDSELAAEALLVLGAAAWRLGDLPASAHLYARAARWSVRAESPAQSTRAFLSLASIRLRLEGPHAAAVTAERAAESALRSGIASMTAHARSDLARYQEAAGDLEGARRGYESALLSSIGGRSRIARGQVLTYLGDLETRVGRPECALPLHNEGVALRRVAGDRIALATSLRGLGKAHLALGEFSPARTALIEALRLFQASGAYDALPTCRLPLARALLRLGRRREAADQATQGLAEWETLDAVARSSQVADGSLEPDAVAHLREEFRAEQLL